MVTTNRYKAYFAFRKGLEAYPFTSSPYLSVGIYNIIYIFAVWRDFWSHLDSKIGADVLATIIPPLAEALQPETSIESKASSGSLLCSHSVLQCGLVLSLQDVSIEVILWKCPFGTIKPTAAQSALMRSGWWLAWYGHVMMATISSLQATRRAVTEQEEPIDNLSI